MTILQTTGAGVAKTQQRAVITLVGSSIVIGAVPGKRLKIYQHSIQSRNDGMTVQLTDGFGGVNLTHIWTFNAREGVESPVALPPVFLYATTAGNALWGVVSGAGSVDLDVSYWDDDAV